MEMDISREEMEYKWVEAAKLYEQTLQSEPLASGLSAAEIWQKIGHFYDLGSRQGASIDDFRSLRRRSVEAYEKAAGLFGQEKNEGRSAQCFAQAEYMRSWVASDASEKIKVLDKCSGFAETSLLAFRSVGNDLGYGQTANLLTACLYDRSYLASSAKEKNELGQEGMKNSDEAVSTLSKLDDKEELLLAYSWASIQAWYVAVTCEDEEYRKNAADKSVSLAEKAMALSKETTNPYSKAMALWAACWSTQQFTENVEVSVKYSQEMLEQSLAARDNFLRGVALYLLADVTTMAIQCEPNPDKRRQKYEEVVKCSEDAIRYLDLVYQDELIAETYLLPAQNYSILASDFAATLSEKIVYSKKAIEIGKKGLEYAIRSGSAEAKISALHGLSKACHYQSNLEPRKENKPEYLKQALAYRKEYVKIANEAFSGNSWILGISKVYLGQIEADLSRLEVDEKNKLASLKEATVDMEDGVLHCKNWKIFGTVPTFIAAVAKFEDYLGGFLDEDYFLTGERANLARANEVYVNAAEGFKKVDLPSRVAESYWKIGKNLDQVDNYDLSARNFENAFAAYKAAAQRICQFSDFYLDYASYMRAWSEIESAKGAHSEEKYESAMQHYEKTSQLLRQSKSWMHLSQNFYAWSLLEQAEDLSRKEKCKEAIDAFEGAIKFLQDSGRILSIKLEGIDKKDERDQISTLIKVSDIREEYCRGRIAIEEAKCLDRKGDHTGSSDKYGKAAEIFQRISLVDSGQVGREAKPLAYLCQAWQRMAMAEARASPIMYQEAAELFKLAKDYTSKESAAFMALGHNSFCKALEAGMEFEITRAMVMYEEAARHMEAAANFYLKAGFEATSDYARATQRFFDAYVFMESAKRERDPEKQIKYYSMAEQVLQAAADCFEKAKYQEKTDQAQELLRKVREERKLALSLSDIFHAPDITSSSASFSAIETSDESAVGLERFEHADIQVKLVQHETEIKVGSTVTLEIQMVNVGKEPVSLNRIESIVPLGFQLIGKPDYCHFEESALTMKGKRLEPLKADEIKITLKSFKTGTIEIKPRIVGLDWVGRQLVNNPDPVVFNVSGAILPGRVPTGYPDLDNLLFGGIPENYSVILASPSSDEREQLIRKFLEAGIKMGQTTFFITSEIGNLGDLIDEFQTVFYVFLCNPRADVMIKNLPNVFKLKGIESLTDIEIALIKSFRTLAAQNGPRRICITIVSDVLLQQHAVMTRKWLSGLLADLKSRGFTTLAVINPEMHPPEEVQAILGLFEGEIRVSEKETVKGLEKILRVRKLYNQRYLENEIALTREKLEF